MTFQLQEGLPRGVYATITVKNPDEHAIINQTEDARLYFQVSERLRLLWAQAVTIANENEVGMEIDSGEGFRGEPCRIIGCTEESAVQNLTRDTNGTIEEQGTDAAFVASFEDHMSAFVFMDAVQSLAQLNFVGPIDNPRQLSECVEIGLAAVAPN